MTIPRRRGNKSCAMRVVAAGKLRLAAVETDMRSSPQSAPLRGPHSPVSRHRAIAAWMILLATVAPPAAHGEPTVVSGLGTLDCASLNAQTLPDGGYRQNGLATAVFSWVQGYLSAWNVIGIVRGGRFADLTSITFDEQWSHVASFCRRNPESFVVNAARDILAKRLKMEQVPAMSRPRERVEAPSVE